jgi:hypothetical protein
VPHESHFFQDERFELFFSNLLEWHSRRFEKLRIGQPEMNRAVAAFLDSFYTPCQTNKGAHRWVEKTPRNILRIDYLFRLFPDAQFIHMIRDPRDTLCSMKQKAATEKPKWVRYTAAFTAPEWVRCIHAGLPWRERPERYMEVRYEQLVRDPKAEMQRVLAFLGEPWCHAVLDASADRVRNTNGGNDHTPIFATSIGRWKRELSPEEIACIQSTAGDTMALLSYEVETL